MTYAQLATDPEPGVCLHCPECSDNRHGLHNDAVTFGLIKCSCKCHCQGYVAGPNAMPWVRG